MQNKTIFSIIAVTAFVIAITASWLASTSENVRAATGDVQPNGTVSVSNSSCTTGNAHTSMDDDPDSPGGDWCDATADGTDHIIELDFDTPPGDPNTTSEAQTVKIYTRKSASGGTDPSIIMTFKCNGTDVEVGASNTVTSESGQLISDTFTFSSGTCATDGSDMSVLIHCSRSGGSPGGRRSCDFDAVEWVADYAEGGGSSGGTPAVQRQSEFFF